MTSSITLNCEQAIAWITLNRPDRKNAFDRPMWEALTQAFGDVAADPAVKCVVLTGAGGAFCTGADIAEFVHERADPAQAEAYGATMEVAYDAVDGCPVPVIAAVEGPCTGAGLVLALLSDLRIAGEGARFGAPVSRLGLAMPHAEFSVLFAAIGKARTLDLVLRARLIDAREALNWGVVTEIAPDGTARNVARKIAETIIEGPPLVHRWHRQLARRLTTGQPLSAEERSQSYASFGTEDYVEGIRAFLERRRPRFNGR